MALGYSVSDPNIWTKEQPEQPEDFNSIGPYY